MEKWLGEGGETFIKAGGIWIRELRVRCKYLMEQYMMGSGKMMYSMVEEHLHSHQRIRMNKELFMKAHSKMENKHFKAN